MNTQIQKRFDLQGALDQLKRKPHTLNVNSYTPEDGRGGVTYKARFDLVGAGFTELGKQASEIVRDLYSQKLEVEEFALKHGRFNFGPEHRRFNIPGTVEYKATLEVMFKTPDQIAEMARRDADFMSGAVESIMNRHREAPVTAEVLETKEIA